MVCGGSLVVVVWWWFDGCLVVIWRCRDPPACISSSISRRRSKPLCSSKSWCNPFARSAGIFIGVRTEERGSTRNPVAGDWENREGYELVLQDLHFSNGILGVLEAMLGCVR